MWIQLLIFQLLYNLSWQLDNPIHDGPSDVQPSNQPPSLPIACNGWENGVCRCSERDKFVNCSSTNLTQFPIGIPNDTLSLNMENNTISFVPDLLYLSELQQIELQRNNINQVPLLPKTIGTIDLHSNQIQNFSTEFVGMRNLVFLNLQSNLLEYLPDGGFTGCSWLSKLRLNRNRLKYLHGSNLEGLDSIANMFIGRNLIENIDARTMEILCKNVQVIDFGYNLLTSIRTGFFSGFSILNDIYLQGNAILKLPNYLFKTPESTIGFGVKLGSVHFNNMTLSEVSDHAFFGVRDCSLLSLAVNQLKNIPKAVTNLNVVNYIVLGNNMITNIPDLAFNGSRKIRGIFLNGNFLQRIPKNAFAKLTQLKELYLYKNQINVIESGAFRDNPLEKLYLFDNNLIEISPNLFRTPSRTIINLHLFFSPVKTIHPLAFTELADNAEIIGTCSELETIPKLQANISLACISEFGKVPRMEFPMIMCSSLKGNGYQCRQDFRHCFCDPCEKGYYGEIQSNGCIECPPGGYYLDEIGVSKGFTYYDNCKTCKNGTYVPPERVPGRSASDCQVCPFGTRTNRVAGSRACRCIDNYYRMYRFGSCFKCTRRGITCPSEYQQLKSGFWWFWRSDDDFYQYSNFTAALVQENYASYGVQNNLIYSGSLPFAQECPKQTSCPGNTINTSCAVGFTGWMCTQCEDGFYPWFDSCNRCPSVWNFLLVYAVIILVLFALTGLILWIDSKRSSTSSEVRTTADMILARGKIVIGFYQVLAGIFSTLSYIHWPQALAYIGQHLQNIALNIFKIASPQCLDPRFKLNAYREFLFGITCPIFVTTSTFLIYMIKKLISKLRKPKHDLPSKMAETKRLCFLYTLSLLFLTYPNSCNTIFSLFPSICQHFWLDNTRNYRITRLKTDYSISCEDESYTIFMYAAYVSLIYVIGFPLGLLFLLWKFRCGCLQPTIQVHDAPTESSGDLDLIHFHDPSKVHLDDNDLDDIFCQDPRKVHLDDNDLDNILYKDPSKVHFDDLDDVRSQLGSSPTIVCKKTPSASDPYGLRAFHESYNSRCWFWEVVELVRKLTLTSLVIFFGSTSRTQIGAAAFLAVLFLILHVAFQPMKDTFEHWLQLLSLATIVLNLLVGVILMVPVPVDDNNNAAKQSALDKADDVGVQIILVLVDFGIILLFTVSTLRSLYKAFKNISKDNQVNGLSKSSCPRFSKKVNDGADDEPLIL